MLQMRLHEKCKGQQSRKRTSGLAKRVGGRALPEHIDRAMGVSKSSSETALKMLKGVDRQNL